MPANVGSTLDDEPTVLSAAIRCSSVVSALPEHPCASISGTLPEAVEVNLRLISTVFKDKRKVQEFAAILFLHSQIVPWLLVMRNASGAAHKAWIEDAVC
jgi:hypothetical protein